ncbi:MAG: hypothetical protein GEU93_04485 [Propionibacteriales bacterium]|nr:hypothetical protein [Propionibacteriales bacterium]
MTASTASADQDSRWIPFQQPDVTAPAGVFCDFEVTGEVLHDREFFKTVATYEDGSPRTELWKGPLVIRFTNTETGESVDRDVSGHQVKQLKPDGSLESITIKTGHTVGAMAEGSSPEKGIWQVGGRHSSLVRHDDGTSSIFLGPNGTAENLCDTLAP